MVGAGVSAGDPVPHGAFLQPVRRGAEGAFRSGAAMNACLEISGLSATLANGTRMLRSVSLTVEPGEVRALVGESGAGKSMIGKAVLGVLPPSVRIVEGRIDLEAAPQPDRRQDGAHPAGPADRTQPVAPYRPANDRPADKDPRLGRRHGR